MCVKIVGIHAKILGLMWTWLGVVSAGFYDLVSMVYDAANGL